MIIYFSGTGSARYIATSLAHQTGEEVISFNERIKKHDTSSLSSAQPWVFICPIHAWRIPNIVEKMIKDTTFLGSTKAYFIVSCGESSGGACKYVEKLCSEKHFELLGFKEIIMPENMICMFKIPTKEEAEQIIKKADPLIEELGKQIMKEEKIKYRAKGTGLASKVVNPLFNHFENVALGFKVDDNCTGCSACASICPMNNIVIIDHKPVWGSNCVNCLACINSCPHQAIQYKNKTQKKNRYFLK